MCLRPISLSLTVSLFLASACTAEESLCATGNQLSIERPELKEELLVEMRKEGIPVEESESGMVCYPQAKADLVREKLIAIDLQQRPSTHITIAGGQFAERVFERLNEVGIEYTYKKIDNGVLLMIAEPENVGAASDIIDDTAISMFGPNE